MKKFLFIPLLFLALLSCDSDDSQPNDHADDSQPIDLSGSWNLLSFQCCLLESEEFDRGDVIWTFNADNTVDVRINTILIENSQLPIQEDSSLPYSSTSSTITLESIEYDYFFEEGQLFLTDEPEVDGSIIIFERR